MLLPIVLLLATTGSVANADNAVPAAGQTNQAPSAPANPGPNTFVIQRHSNRQMPDQGIIIPQSEGRNNGCLSIQAYVFSDGGNPQLQYVTDCPNLVVPYQNKKAQGQGTSNEHQPSLKRTSQ